MTIALFLLQMATCYHCRDEFCSGEDAFAHAKGEHHEKEFIICKVHLDERSGKVRLRKFSYGMKPLQGQLDRAADTPSHSPTTCDQPSVERSAVAETSGGGDSNVYDKFQDNNNTLKIYTAANVYDMTAESDSCKVRINKDDKIHCCFLCKLMFCTSCLMKYCHNRHQNYLARYACLQDYMTREEV